MRILIVTNTYPPAEITGVGALVHELAKALDGEGHRVCVLTRRAEGSDPWAVATGGRKLLFPLHAVLRLRELLDAEPIDLVHVHESDGVLVVLYLWLARRLRPRGQHPRLVATLQVSYRRERLAVRPVSAGERIVSRPTVGERVFAWVRAPILSLLGRMTARLSDAVVAPSRVTAKELEEDYGARQVEVIPNGVPRLSEVAVPRADPAWLTVLYAGRLRTRKAVGVLVEAFASVIERAPDARLLIAGDGEHRQALEERVREIGLEDHVRFLGAVPRPDLLRLYGEVDVFCLPSIYEGFPVAILEAMAAGLPVVSTTVSGIPEAVVDGEGGLLVAPENAVALSEALCRLLLDSTLRRQLSIGARARIRNHFSITEISERYLRLFLRVGTSRQGE